MNEDKPYINDDKPYMNDDKPYMYDDNRICTGCLKKKEQTEICHQIVSFDWILLIFSQNANIS